MDLSNVLQNFGDNPGQILTQVLTTIIISSLLTLLIRPVIDIVLRRTVKTHKNMTAVERQKRIATLAAVFYTLFTIIIWLVAVFVILGQLQVNLLAAATGAGLIGILVGFGAQNTVTDFLAGIFIIGENQYRVGDIVSLQISGRDITGTVESVSIRITRLRDLDGNLHIVRNGLAEAVSNLSFKYANVNIDLSVAYDSDVDVVEQVVNKVGTDLSQDPEWRDHFFSPIQFLRVDGFQDSSVRIKALGSVEPAQQWAIGGEYRRRIKKAFEQHSIMIPYPQMVIHTSGCYEEKQRKEIKKPLK